MGLTNFDIVQANAFIGSPLLTQGKTWFVKAYSGSDNRDGLSPRSALKTLLQAQSQAKANQNDVVNMFAESDTASLTTDYQSATLAWAKDGVHLVGVNARQALSQRSRVAFASTYATASNLFTLSANGCLIANMEFFAGVASVLPTGCFNVTGERNHIVNCHIAGLGGAAGANDIAGAYSLRISGQENLFEDCVIGVDTITLGAALNSQLLMGGGAARNIFRRCLFVCNTSHATNHVFARIPAASIDRFLIFEDCQFINPVNSGSTSLTSAFVVDAAAGGSVVLAGGKTAGVGFSHWNSANTANVVAVSGTPASATFGLGVNVTLA
jgi:hypothetical protein